MIQNNKPIDVVPSNPGFATEIEGAPVSMPGGNDGTPKSPMTGTAVASASVPPPISSDLAGAPEAGQEVVSAKPIEAPAVNADKEDDGAESKPIPASDTEHEEASPTDEEKKRAEEERERAENERQRAEAVAGSDRQIKTIQL